MAEFVYKAKSSHNIGGKARVYFTCHPEDLDSFFERICADIFKTHDCAIYYTEDMTEPLTEENLELDLGRMNLFVVPITLKLLIEDNRAMVVDIPLAIAKGIPILPIMMEGGFDEVYSRKDRFGERQYISPDNRDGTEIPYEQRLKSFLDSSITNDEMRKKVREAFDAYVFLSYRKKDRRYANELMRLIHSVRKYRDVAIWYDEFITLGESFRENINRALSDSRLFALLVTPNLLEKPNFVMDEEYPAARKIGKSILPVEMVETDKEELASNYTDIPDCISSEEREAMYDRLEELLADVTVTENDDDPEHNYLIGLAYLHGIDVEVDRERGMEMITSAAEAECFEAMDKIYEIYQVRGNFRECLRWAKRLYEYHLRTKGPDHEQTVVNLVNIGYSYASLEDHESALIYTEQACEAAERVFGKSHNYTLMAKNNLAVSYLHTGDAEKAKEMLEEVYRIRCEIFGEEDAETVVALGNLAGVYCELDDDSGLPLLEKVYEIRRRTLGDEHPDTLNALYNLSEQLACKDMDGAYEKQIKVYHDLCRVLGEEHPDTLTSMISVALAESDRGNSGDAIRYLERGRAISLSLLGEDNPTTRKFILYLAIEYRTVKDAERCLYYFNELHDICLRTLGEDHEETREAAFELHMAQLLFK